MTLAEALRQAHQRLAAHRIDDASLEAEILLRHTLGKSRNELYLDLNKELSSKAQAAYWKLVERRLVHEPTAYIIGHREFYGLDFYVDRRVLIPRPESELLVDKALEWSKERRNESPVICEVGAGSGAIAVTVASYLPRAQVYAIDVSAQALEVTAINCRRHGVEDRVHLIHGSLLENLSGPADLVIANLPYLTRREMGTLPPEIARYEPGLALDGGESGLDVIMALCGQLAGKLRPGGLLLLEIGAGQAGAVVARLKQLEPQGEAKVSPDLSGNERVVSLRLVG